MRRSLAGNIGRNKRILLEGLRGFDAHEESRALEKVKLARKAEVVRELEQCALMEEVSWRQKSRVLWLMEGDKCTKFFHSIANLNRRHNATDSLMIEDNISSNQAKICEHIVFFL
jgi:precorrin-6B methylase 1